MNIQIKSILDIIFNLGMLSSISIFAGFMNAEQRIEKYKRVFHGLLFGAASVLGMLNPLVLAPGLIFDGRSVMLSICGLFFGPLSAGIAAFMAMALRIYQGGSGAFMGVFVIVTASLTGIMFNGFNLKKNRTISIKMLLLMGFIVHGIMASLMFTLPAELAGDTFRLLALPVLITYPLTTVFIGSILIEFEQHRKRTKQLKNSERDLKESYAALESQLEMVMQQGKALRESEERHENYMYNAPYGIFVTDEKGQYLDVNPAAAKISGYSEAELLKMNIRDLLAEESLEAGTAHFQAVTNEGRAYGAFTFKHKNGEIRWWTVSAAKLSETRFLGFCDDITESRIVEEKIEQTKKTYENIFNSLTEAVYIQDSEGTFIDVNRGAELMYGFSRKELIGKNPSLVSAEGLNDLERVRKLCGETFTTGRPSQFEFWGRRKNGEIFPKDVAVNKGRYFDQDVLIAAARDITERKRAEDLIQYRLTCEQAASRISAWAVNTDDVDRFQEDCMELLGKSLDISRSYIFKHFHESDTMNNTSEWVARGVSPQKDYLQNVPSSQARWCIDLLKSGKEICFADIHDVPDKDTRDIFDQQEILSVLLVPLFSEKQYYGFMGFDECRGHRQWTQADVNLLITISRIITGVIDRKKAENVLAASMEEVKRFNAFMVGRELRMMDLKKEINALLNRLGEAPKYPAVSGAHENDGIEKEGLKQ